MRSTLCGLLVAGCVACLAPAALGQTTDRAAAEALFRSGREAMDAGRYDEACRRFAESNRLDPAVGTVFNLAACNEARGHLAAAWQGFREVMDRLPQGDDRVAIARERVEAIEPRLAHIVLTMPDPPPKGTLVRQDGVELTTATLGVELPADPGAHEIVVEAPGHEPSVKKVALTEGQHAEVVLALGPAVSASPEAAAAAPPSDDPKRDAGETGGSTSTLGWVLGGIGVAGIGTSLVAGSLALGKKSTVDSHCDGNLCDPEGLDAASAGRTLTTVGTVSFAVGMAALGAGIYFILSSDDDGEATTAAISPRSGGGTFSLRRTF